MAEKIKVKQSTIDDIKKKGMTKALASAKTNRSPEYQEALRRMYGERRLKEAMKGAQGGSASRETYMKRGYSGAPTSPAKKTSAGPKMGGGQGYAGAPKSSKTKSSRGSKVAAGVGAAAAVGAAGVYAKGKSEQKKMAAMNKRQKAAYEKKRAEKVARRGAAVTKLSQSKTGKAIGKTARAVTSTAAKRTAVGAAALYAAPKAMSTLREQKQKTEARRKAGKKDSSAGGARAAAMKRARGR
jgi:hypothetical protein